MKIKSALSCLAILASTACATPQKSGHLDTSCIQMEQLIKQAKDQECTDGKYDRDIRCMKDSFNEAYNSSLEVTVMGFVVGTDPENDEKITINPKPVLAGSGLLLKNGYVLTAHHVMNPDPEQSSALNLVPGSLMTFVEIQGKNYLVQPVYGDKTLDFQLLKTKEPVPNNTYLPTIGNPDELRIGDATYIIGNSLGLGVSMREGIVSQQKIKSPKFLEGLINISNGANLGDSGSSVYAIRDGKLELMGINTMVGRGNNLTYFRPIDDIIKSLDEAKVDYPLKKPAKAKP